MSGDFTKNVALATVFTLGLLLVNPLRGVAARIPILGPHLTKLIHELNNGELNANDLHALALNYYEGIENNPLVLEASENGDVVVRDDFLRYEYRPNRNRRYAAGMRITNSLGMVNPEYGYDKPPNTRRIALLGDSVSVGPYGQNYVALLEERLNRDLPPGAPKIQILNFSVPGYVLPQKMDIALEKVPKFHPDAYILQLSQIELGSTYRHLRRLWISGYDLKYDYFRRVALQAGLRKDDRQPRADFKLAPFDLPMMRWSAEQIRNHAVSEGKPMIVIMIPSAIDADVTGRYFDQLHQVADGLGVPVIDLRDTFRSAKLSDFQVIPRDDIHPNVRGHEMIFNDLYAQLKSRKDAMSALVGSSSATGAATH